MFIYHFNRMIRSRILWLVFAVIIAVAFLSVDSCRQSPSDNDVGSNAVGTLGDREVSYDEYDKVRFFLQIANPNSDLSPAATETQIWAHIAAFRKADELGLIATESEIRSFIMNDPSFQANGAFDMGLYQEILYRNLGLNPQSYEYFLSQRLILGKLYNAVSAGALASEMEIQDAAAALTDTFFFSYATVTNGFTSAKVDVTEDDLRKYYEENSASYALPDRVRVRFISVPVTNFTGSVAITADDISDYYDSDPSLYTREGTNGVEQLTLEEATPAISNELVLAEARYAGSDALGAFMDEVITNDLETFSWRAKARFKAKYRDTSFISVDTGFIPGVESSALEEFRQGAIELDSADEDARYAVATGDKNVYLMCAFTNSPAHTQDFETVKDSIEPIIISQKRQKLFDDYAAAQRDAIKAKMAGASFADACKALALEVSTQMVYTASAPVPAELSAISGSLRDLLTVKAGDLTKPINTFRGAIIGFVESRDALNDFEYEQTKNSIAQEISQSKIAQFTQSWMIWNLESQGFTSRNIVEDEDYDYSEDE